MAATPEHAARVLGLDDQATLEDVRDVRRKLALKYHPDCSDDTDRSSRHMARINAAADVLIAHLKALGTKAKRPNYTDFTKHYTSNRKAHGTSEGSRNAKSPGANHQEKRAAREAEEAPQAAVQASVAIAEQQQRMSSKDRELIDFAVKSYRSVLDQIGRVDAGPRVDATALAYPVPA